MGRWAAAAAAAGAGAPDDGWSLEREDEPLVEGPEDASLPAPDISSRTMATCHPIISIYLIVMCLRAFEPSSLRAFELRALFEPLFFATMMSR